MPRASPLTTVAETARSAGDPAGDPQSRSASAAREPTIATARAAGQRRAAHEQAGGRIVELVKPIG